MPLLSSDDREQALNLDRLQRVVGIVDTIDSMDARHADEARRSAQAELGQRQRALEEASANRQAEEYRYTTERRVGMDNERASANQFFATLNPSDPQAANKSSAFLMGLKYLPQEEVMKAYPEQLATVNKTQTLFSEKRATTGEGPVLAPDGTVDFALSHERWDNLTKAREARNSLDPEGAQMHRALVEGKGLTPVQADRVVSDHQAADASILEARKLGIKPPAEFSSWDEFKKGVTTNFDLPGGSAIIDGTKQQTGYYRIKDVQAFLEKPLADAYAAQARAAADVNAASNAKGELDALKDLVKIPNLIPTERDKHMARILEITKAQADIANAAGTGSPTAPARAQLDATSAAAVEQAQNAANPVDPKIVKTLTPAFLATLKDPNNPTQADVARFLHMKALASNK